MTCIVRARQADSESPAGVRCARKLLIMITVTVTLQAQEPRVGGATGTEGPPSQWDWAPLSGPARRHRPGPGFSVAFRSLPPQPPRTSPAGWSGVASGCHWQCQCPLAAPGRAPGRPRPPHRGAPGLGPAGPPPEPAPRAGPAERSPQAVVRISHRPASTGSHQRPVAGQPGQVRFITRPKSRATGMRAGPGQHCRAGKKLSRTNRTNLPPKLE
jgi:hypothetical protein